MHSLASVFTLQLLMTKPTKAGALLNLGQETYFKLSVFYYLFPKGSRFAIVLVQKAYRLTFSKVYDMILPYL